MERTARWRRLAPIVVGALLAAAGVLVVEGLVALAERGGDTFSRLAETLKVVARRGVLDHRVTGGSTHDPRLLPWLIGLVLVARAGRRAAEAGGRTPPGALAGASRGALVGVAYGGIWALAALASFRTIVEEAPLTLLWPLGWGVAAASIAGALAGARGDRGDIARRVAAAGGIGLVAMAVAGSLALTAHGLADPAATGRFLDRRSGLLDGSAELAVRLPTALAHLERLGTFEAVERPAPLADPGEAVSLTSWPAGRREAYGPLREQVRGGDDRRERGGGGGDEPRPTDGGDEPRPTRDRTGPAPAVWWLLVLVPVAGGIASGWWIARGAGPAGGPGAGRRSAVAGAAAGLVAAAAIQLLLAAGSPVTGVFDRPQPGPPPLEPFVRSALFLAPSAALAAATMRRRNSPAPPRG